MSAFLHYNQGSQGRFKQFMSTDELALCRHHFGDYLELMGY
jgi:hypothetical protein